MCRMCHKYGKRLILSPINEYEQVHFNWFYRMFGAVNGMKAFRFWHKYFVKD